MAIDVIPNPVITPQEEISKGITGDTIDSYTSQKLSDASTIFLTPLYWCSAERILSLKWQGRGYHKNLRCNTFPDLLRLGTMNRVSD